MTSWIAATFSMLSSTQEDSPAAQCPAVSKWEMSRVTHSRQQVSQQTANINLHLLLPLPKLHKRPIAHRNQAS